MADEREAERGMSGGTPTGWDALPIVANAIAHTACVVTGLVLIAAGVMFVAVWAWSRWDR